MNNARFVLTKETLDRLLATLDGDRVSAGKKYESLRLGLVRFFEWRGCARPADHADEAIDRLARRLSEGDEIRDVAGYAAGVARLLWKEIVKESVRQRAALQGLQSLHSGDMRAPDEPPSGARQACLARCLAQLEADNARLLVAYYQGEKGEKIEQRKRLAQQLDLSPSALRMKMMRLRGEVDDCVSDCLARHTERGN